MTIIYLNQQFTEHISKNIHNRLFDFSVFKTENTLSLDFFWTH